jgi:hypothetical protein
LAVNAADIPPVGLISRQQLPLNSVVRIVALPVLLDLTPAPLHNCGANGRTRQRSDGPECSHQRDTPWQWHAASAVRR